MGQAPWQAETLPRERCGHMLAGPRRRLPKVDNCAKKALDEQSTVSGGLNPWRKRACGWSPQPLLRTVTPKRPPNAELRRREHLTEIEVERLMEAAKGNRWGRRDATMILVAYRHGLRAAELVDLRWDQVDFRTATLFRRVKKGTPRPVQFSATNCGRCGGTARAGPQVALRVHLGATQHNAKLLRVPAMTAERPT